ncbi:hypothetical protein V9K67_08660 [Paraflavisolibacter sp. H34]|uniref:hypothetical protein n=1 Tax=Huijunlia imazamoxiresistens TaxID=3127457 RepID=UPI0030167566
MRFLSILSAAVLLMASCKNNEVQTATNFCDTTCVTETFKWDGEAAQKSYVTLSVNNCLADTLTWFHKSMESSRSMHMGTLMDNTTRPSKDAIKVQFVGNKAAWLTYNDCMTGRGFMVVMPFDKKESLRKMSSALNSFDKKFVVPDDLRAYADYSNIFVEDINTGKVEKMSFKKEYTIHWNNIHETIDSINVSKNRIFVQLKENGENIPLEKNISL